MESRKDKMGKYFSEVKLVLVEAYRRLAQKWHERTHLSFVRREVVLWMAVKSLISRRFRTVLTLCGIIIGFAAVLFLVSFGWGLEGIVVKEVTGSKNSQMLDVTTGGSSVLKITSENLNEWRQIKQVKMAGGNLELPMYVSYGDKSTEGLAVIGEDDYFNITSNVDNGSPPKDKQGAAVLSKKLAQTLGLEDQQNAAGKKINFTLVVNRNYQKKIGEDIIKIENKDFTVSSVTEDTETSQMNLRYSALTSEANVSGFSHAVIVANSSRDIPLIRKLVENQGFHTDYIGDTVSQISQIFGLFRVVLASFGLTALVVASIGMLNTLTITLLEKTKEVGLMKAIGVKRYDILRMFIYEAVLLGGIGGLGGVIFGWMLAILANYLVNQVAGLHGGSYIVLFQASVWFYVVLLGCSFVLGFITGIVPALRASRLNPLDAIRYE